MSRDVLANSSFFSSRVCKVARFFTFRFRESVTWRESIIQRETVVCSKKALFCGVCCDRNQAIILGVLVLVSLLYLYIEVL